MSILLKSERDIEMLRISGAILGRILRALAVSAKKGVRLMELDAQAQELLCDEGARAAFLGYKPEGAVKAYPAALCTSVNQQIVHGVPSKYVLKEGDILKIDFGVDYNGFITDGALTVGIEKISKTAKRLMKATEDALADAIAVCAPGVHLGDIGHVIELRAAKNGFGVAQGLTGHGVGFALHEDPTVYNFGRKGEGMKLVPGLVIAIEPMFTAGAGSITQMKDDSYATRDGSIAAHFEHTIAVNERGIEVLTK